MSTPRAVQEVVERLAEKRLRNWSHLAEVTERIEHEHELAVVGLSLHPFVTLSRETGAGASEVAARLAERLHCEVLDRELLHCLAEEIHVSEDQLAHLDETSSRWMESVINYWMNAEPMTREQYLSRLRLLLLRSVRLSSQVIVGRGAQFLLPREKGMAVRLVASLRQRIQRVMIKHGWPRGRAEDHIRSTDHQREAFVKEFFHRDVSDSHLYDLVINMDYFDIDAAADLIVQHFHRRWR